MKHPIVETSEPTALTPYEVVVVPSLTGAMEQMLNLTALPGIIDPDPIVAQLTELERRGAVERVQLDIERSLFDWWTTPPTEPAPLTMDTMRAVTDQTYERYAYRGRMPFRMGESISFVRDHVVNVMHEETDAYRHIFYGIGSPGIGASRVSWTPIEGQVVDSYRCPCRKHSPRKQMELFSDSL